MGSRLALTAFVFTLSACASPGNDASTVHPPAADATASTSVATTPFYVDFRTRPDSTIHTFVQYGAQDPSGRPLERKTAGFFLPHALGALIAFVAYPGEIGSEDYYANLPSSTTFHQNLTSEQYERLTRYIDSERAKPQIFSFIFNNCNDFVAGAAHAIGLKVPFLRMLPPTLFIKLLAQMNS
jgi:hypothetical protein